MASFRAPPTEDRHRLSDASAPPPPAMASASPFKGAAKKMAGMMDAMTDAGTYERQQERHGAQALAMDDDEEDMDFGVDGSGGGGYSYGGGGGGGGGFAPEERRGSASKSLIMVENRTDLEVVARVKPMGITLPFGKPNETLVGGHTSGGLHQSKHRKKAESEQTLLLKTQLDTGAINQEEYDVMLKAYKKSHTLERELEKWEAVKKVRTQDVEHPQGEVKCLPGISNTVSIHFSPALKGKSPQYREAPICETKARGGQRVIVYYNCDGYVVAAEAEAALAEIEKRARDIAQGRAKSKVHCSACGSIVTCPSHAALGTVSFKCPNCSTLLELNVAGQ